VVDLLDCAHDLAAGASVDSDPGFDAAPLPGGGGIARVETARGTLLHAARIDDGRIADYAIVAPTEWNLHPAGAMVRELADRAFEDRASARRHLHRLTLALDPCVAFEVSLDGADSQY
jgi:coenzyme F420-reducing hydrogenase alpha subunit